MSFKRFKESLCNSGITATTNGYQLRKTCDGLSTAGLRGWLKGGLPVKRDEKGHMVFDVSETVCWLANNNRLEYAGLLFDKYAFPSNNTDSK